MVFNRNSNKKNLNSLIDINMYVNRKKYYIL